MMHAEPRPRELLATPRIFVARGGRWTTVDVRRLYVVEHEGVLAVNLADVWVAGGLRGDLFALSFDLLDADGHHASVFGEAGLDAERFAKGWLAVESHDAFWDTADLVPDHWHMRGVTTIVAVSPNAIHERPPLRRRGSTRPRMM